MRSASSRWITIGTAVFLAMAAVAAGASGGTGPGLGMALPPGLSTAGPNVVAFTVDSPLDQRVQARFTLTSPDGLVTEAVFDEPIELRRGANERSFSIGPERLAPFALGETVRLDGAVGPWKASADLVVLAEVPESGGWVLNVPTTAVLYSTQDSLLNFRIVNPKNKPISAKLALKFKNLKGKIVAKWKYPVIALPGDSLYSVTVPVSVCLKAKLESANSLKTFIMKDGVKKASGQSLLDWDLVVSTSADKTSGAAPLTVSFTALVSGGSAPYAFVWHFGDGTANATVQNPSHTFATPGLYTVDLVVVDNRGGTVNAAPITIVAQ